MGMLIEVCQGGLKVVILSLR